MTLKELVGKRCLLRLADEKWRASNGDSNVDEYKILEVSNSQNWVRIQNVNGRKFWKAASNVAFIEQLVQFEKCPN